ncbi:MAG TPA: glycoside hydrolase family 38 C-terminal domain-containing protein [Bacteroidales bacterium]
MKLVNSIILCFLLPLSIVAQQTNRVKYDIAKEKGLYVIGYAHLDSEWNWDYPATINEYIRNIMTENFYLFEKYPGYVFNFTGSRRYQMMKEYYPDLYKKVVEYVKQGRWYVSGSSVDEGEVNMSSSEALIRQVLYGNRFFKQEFGKTSVDYMLPDCFGFLANLPSIWSHCGLIGFSTQKLTWHSAAGIPFNVGLWVGPDGKSIISALNATSYNGNVEKRLDLNSKWDVRLDDNFKKYGISFDYRYYGVGDQGGAPREKDIKNALGSIGNADSKFKVLLTSSDQMYKDITPEIRAKLPKYTGDLLLTEHSAGSLTSEAYLKGQNRKNEILALESEQVASFADWMGLAGYPFSKLNNSWNLVLGSQFHDILPGTSIPKAYEYAWNDEFIATNGFSEVLKYSVAAISENLDTRSEGRSLVVYNPVAQKREDIVTAEINFSQTPVAIEIVGPDGEIIPSQIIGHEGNSLKFIFSAKVPSMSLAVYQVKISSAPKAASTLKISGNEMENDFYRVKMGDHGDIISIFDKKASREILSGPAKLEFLEEQPDEWPSWNMDWKDRKKPAIDAMDKDAKISIAEQGPVRVSFKITRNGRGSEITQFVSLSVGEAGKRVEVTNKINWHSQKVSLKAAFPLTVSNNNATYNLGVGTIERSNNNEKKFEVPSKEWFDLTDKSGKYGVSILEDCKYGSDKPDDNVLRLTLLYTPGVNQSWRWCTPQETQDWGIHDVRYAIYGHKGDWCNGQSQWQGEFFNKPLLAFETDAHHGSLGKEISLLENTYPQVGIMSFKKMEEGDYYLIRVNELNGKDHKSVSIKFPGKIIDAYEVNGQEEKIGSANSKDKSLTFDLSHYTIRSFAVKFATSPIQSTSSIQKQLALPYNQDGFSFDQNRDDGDFFRGNSYPGELLPEKIISEDIQFNMGNIADEENNMVTCKGQTIDIPSGDFDKIYFLAAADNDTKGSFVLDNETQEMNIQGWTGYIGQFYNREFTSDMTKVVNVSAPFVKKDNIAWFASHCHESYPSKNDAYKYCYIYKYSLDLSKGGIKKLTLPQNTAIKIFAITLVKSNIGNIRPAQPLSDDFATNPSYIFNQTNN